ncbi:MAG: hypothetical protein EA350_07880 [Gemmatimonadales bacterium]|nr:MAG: hypothetical protein EA350_07880 [Gemmatimonadales bacterium]
MHYITDHLAVVFKPPVPMDLPTPNSRRLAPLGRPAAAAAFLAVIVLAVACDSGEEWAPFEEGWDPNHPMAAQVLAAPDRGDPIDMEMADAGERWFRVRGCLACHRVDGVDVAGPYLNGVTIRRDYEWFRAMVLRPDSMIRMDPVARDLAEIYRVAMPIQGVNDLQVRALWEYLRRIDGGAGPGGAGLPPGD